MAFKYGYRPDPRTDAAGNDLIAKDLKFSTDLKPRLAVQSPGDVDLRPFMLDMDQLQLSSCVGNSTAQSVYILNAQVPAWPHVPVSRLFIYNLARNEQPSDDGGSTNLNSDSGTFIRLAFDVLSRFGVCPETEWPYDPAQVFTLPSMMAQRAASGHKLHSYYRIDQDGDARLAEIIAALRAHHPVVFGTQIDNAFENYQAGTVAQKPRGNTLGGHAMCILGYRQSDGAFLVKNSWGPGWGEGGCVWVDPALLTWDQTFDIWVPTLGTSFTY